MSIYYPIDYHLPQILPFYDSIDKQQWRRCGCSPDDRSIVKRICSQKRLIPFQIKRLSNPTGIVDMTVGLYNVNDELVVNLLLALDADDADIVTVGEYDYIIYYGNIDLDPGLNCGLRYIRWSDGITTQWSELFMIKDFSTDANYVGQIWQDFIFSPII